MSYDTEYFNDIPDEERMDLDIEVEMDSWGEASTPDVIGTDGLGPCVGVIIYDHRRKHAIVAHLMAPSFGLPQEFVDAVQERYPDKSGLKVYLGGAEPASELGIEEIEKDRTATIEGFKRIGFKENQISKKWAAPKTMTGMAIDTKTGKVTYKSISDEEFEEDEI